MATAATISIKLDAQTATLRRGFQRAETQVNKFRQSMEGMAARFAKVTAAIAVATAAINRLRAAAQRMNEIIAEGAETADFADRIGADVEQLQALQAVAEQFGGSAEAVNTALQRLTRRAQTAAVKGGELAEAFKGLNIDIEQFNRLNPIQQALTLADAIEEAAKRGEELHYVTTLMDQEAAELTQTFALGRDELEQQMKSMAAATVVAEEHIRALQETDATLKEYNRTMTRFAKTAIASVILGMKDVGTWIGERFPEEIMKADRAFSKFMETTSAGTLEDFEIQSELAQIPQHVSKVPEAMKETKKTAQEITREIQRWTETPGVGAVTASTAAGFSAAQAGRRRAADRAKYESQMIALMAELIRVTEEREEIVPVSL